jgi:gamma-D-glutamyl-L-lysine dipeptidyl-peptidase
MNKSPVNKGIANSAYIPLRRDASSSSEMTSQILFGETFDILETGKGLWLRVRNHYDGYTGWINTDASSILDEDSLLVLNKCNPSVLSRRFSSLKKASGNENMIISAGSILHRDSDDTSRVFCGEWYQFENENDGLSGEIHKDLHYLTGEFQNTPYLWGGKSAFGTDCSGLVQTLFRILGIMTKRDTTEQHREGRTVNMLSESKTGDLVFFAEDEENISHVGILLDPARVIHASGHVRIDPIDNQGIYNQALKSYSHKLRLIKRII